MLHPARRSRLLPLISALLTLAPGCQLYIDQADRQVAHLIASKQNSALSEERPAPIDQEHSPAKVPKSAYSFAPDPVDPVVPASLLTTRPASQPGDFDPTAAISAGPTSQPSEQKDAATRPAQDKQGAGVAASSSRSDSTETEQGFQVPTSAPSSEASRPILTLSQSLAYAFAHSREFQSAKEDLYLSALALSLERHLWTPQFTGNIGTQYANYGEIRNFDQAMAAVAQVGVEQRLPLGGTVTAKVVDNLMRDLTHHVTTGEDGQAVLAANIPLLRGAGLVALETRFQAERDLIYAVRTFESFRRALSVQIAGDYFNLQELRQAITNARDTTKSLRWLSDRARAYYQTGRVILLEAQRAEQDLAFAENREIDAVESYRLALDQFKLRIGMPTDTPIDVPEPAEPGVAEKGAAQDTETRELEDALMLPGITEAAAIDAAMKYRLDLINTFDRIDDAARGVKVAENDMLPNLNATGSVGWDTNPNHLNAWNYRDDRATWRAGLNLEIPFERYAERNALRNAEILKRRAQRDYQAARDGVVLQVRRDLHVIEQQRISLAIQTRNRDLAQFRRKGAQIQFLKNRVSNREVTDAEAALLDARNRLAQAQAQLRLSILQFRRDTGLLRVDDSGKWMDPLTTAERPVATTQPTG